MDPRGCRSPNGEPLSPRSGQDPIRAIRPFPAWSPADREFDEVATATLAQSTTVWTQVASYRAPIGHDAMGMYFGTDVDVCDAWTDVRFRITVNGAVWLGYPAICQVAGMSQDTMTRIFCPFAGGQMIAVEAINANATPRVVRARIKGMYRPGSEDRV